MRSGVLLRSGMVATLLAHSCAWGTSRHLQVTCERPDAVSLRCSASKTGPCSCSKQANCQLPSNFQCPSCHQSLPMDLCYRLARCLSSSLAVSVATLSCRQEAEQPPPGHAQGQTGLEPASLNTQLPASADNIGLGAQADSTSQENLLSTVAANVTHFLQETFGGSSLPTFMCDDDDLRLYC